jgi:UDP-N-acetylglucosamine--N-acetylmuramyl-(pentapeptide) pyrophosphoryl-undecaprenol N-acetylglucosamine transferase
MTNKKTNNRWPRVIISGGGTGGHIFPAVAIARGIQEQYPSADILFVGAQGKMEMEKVPAAGFPIEGLWISGLQRSLTLKNLLFPLKVLASVWKALRIIRKFKPDVAIGVGGYASGSLLYAASMKGIPCLIQEQNSFPGITNKILKDRVQTICVAYDKMERFFPSEKIVLTGNPVRKEITKLEGKRERGLEKFNLDSTKKTVLVVGGSLGARSINHSIDANLQLFADNDIQLIWQTGKLYTEQAKKRVDEVGKKGISSLDFIADMDLAYAVADVVISRAGALAVSELCLVKKPAILVPLPSAAEDHQTKNAMSLVSYNAAILVKDSEAKEHLVQDAIALVNDQEQMDKLSRNIEKLAFANATETIVSEVMKLINK